MKRIGWLLALIACSSFAVEPEQIQRLKVPPLPSPQGDERGMANQIGPATYQRCAWHMQQPGAKAYELSHFRTNTMPASPFAGAAHTKAKPTAGIPGTAHAFNSEQLGEGAEPAQQGTQMDALGHFAYLRQPWDGKSEFPADAALYYGGFTQKDVKPTADSPLLRLGIEKAPPIVTSAVLFDAKAYKKKAMEAGELVTAQDLEGMLKAQGLGKRGVLPGDVVYVRTGWSDHWRDPDTEKFYYTKAPGLSFDAAQWLAARRIVVIALDTPFVDTVAEGQLQGKGGPAPGTPPGLPFAVHHHMLSQAGIHLVENAKLDELAADRVWTSCTMILPLRDKGAAGSAVRPIAIGAPSKAAAQK
ncbi:MAG TPA: cyclase family protein [Burkholderiales bacterium]|nr:cyclase family protein [Burkholderiales bacterium]